MTPDAPLGRIGNTGTVIRHVSTELEARISGTCHIVWSMAVAHGAPLSEEDLIVRVDGVPVASDEFTDVHGTRLYRTVADGRTVSFSYRATVDGPAAVPPAAETDLVTYLRPSRYCESDKLGPVAWQEFSGLAGQALLDAVGDWVHDHLSYVGGSSRGTDSAVDTLLARKGVCRDFAHLAITLLRAMNVPARLVSCYAPGLEPAEFHAVVEAHVDGRWLVIDPTRKAARTSLVRIATGRDAADTAFITNHFATLTLTRLEVTATTEEPTTPDDQRSAVELR